MFLVIPLLLNFIISQCKCIIFHIIECSVLLLKNKVTTGVSSKFYCSNLQTIVNSADAPF